MCAQWQEGFDAFFADMGPIPSKGLTLERVDVNKGYEPGNCIWASVQAQARNTRRNVFIERNGCQYLFIDLIRALGLKTSTVCTRKSRGWPETRWFEPYTVEEAIEAFDRQQGDQPM